jgi:RNA polymerase sigma-70 factor (ECF subfamily)
MAWPFPTQVDERGLEEPEPVAEHIEDLQLVERMLAGEDAAFEAFGACYFKALYRFTFARLQGDRDLTRELVQIAVTKALAKLDTYRGEASLLTWLCACCRNEILMHFRRRQTAPAEVELNGDLDAVPSFDAQRSGDPEAVLLRRETAHLVHVALDGLPDHYSRALEWKYVNRLSVNEIAWRLGMQPKAAESLLTRARQAFRTSYESLSRAFAAGRDEEGPDHG